MKLTAFCLLAGLSLAACNMGAGSASIHPESTDDQKKDLRLDTLKFPKADHYVNDFDDILTTNQEAELDRICSDYDKKTTNQIVVATFKTYAPYDNIETFSTDLFNEWGIGTSEKDNGLMIVVFKDQHKARIEAGLGTEKVLTNEVCGEIMQQQLIPNFKEGKYYEGIKAGIEESIKRWKN